MMVFADTSALLKLFLGEPFTAEVRALVGQAEAQPAVCRIAWVEALAGLARRQRQHSADEAAVNQARRELRRVWPRFTVVEVTQPLLERAGDYAETFALRAYDAVQLASARELALAVQEPLYFACFDRRLNQAARLLDLETPFAEDL